MRWSKYLVTECRNREMVPFGKMGALAREALNNLRFTGKDKPMRVEFYSEAGWIRASNGYRCVGIIAYRIVPGWNPMEKKGGAK